MIHNPDHAVPVTTSITMHEAVRAVRQLAEQLEPERLSDYYVHELFSLAALIKDRLEEHRRSSEVKVG